MANSNPKPPNAGKGRPKGALNKTTVQIKDAILAAAEAAGGEGGVSAYLTRQAEENPVAFMTLLGKIIPLQVSGEGGGPLQVSIIRFSE